MTFLRNVWNGKTYSLATHYWGFAVAPAVLFKLYGMAVNHIENDDVAIPLAVLGVPLFVAAYAFSIVNLGGLQKIQRDSTSGWAGAAFIFAGIGVLVTTVANIKLVISFISVLVGVA